jgi:hypothetical protein
LAVVLTDHSMTVLADCLVADDPAAVAAGHSVAVLEDPFAAPLPAGMESEPLGWDSRTP